MRRGKWREACSRLGHWALLGSWALLGCAGADHPPPNCPPVQAAVAAASRHPEPEPEAALDLPNEFVRGPSLTPSAVLIEWLDAQSAAEPAPLLVRVPLTFTLASGKPETFSAWLGDQALEIDDGLLRQGVRERLERACSQRPKCTLSVVGYWRGRSGAPPKLYLTDVGAVYPDAGAPLPSFVEIASTATSDECSDLLLRKAGWSRDYGSQHPRMVALDARLLECPKPIRMRPLQCRAEKQRLLGLEAAGKGRNHPEVKVARRRSEACDAALISDGE